MAVDPRLGLFHQPLWREQVLGPGRRIGESQRRLLDRLIRGGQAPFVLTHMFLPGCNAEDLEKAVRPVSVPEERPARRSSSASRLSKVVHSLEKGCLPFRRDGVLNRHDDGSGVWLGVERQPWLWPVDGRLPV